MKALRIYAIMSLGFCLWILLFPPWIDSEYALIWYPDATSSHQLGHHWRFSAPLRPGWAQGVGSARIDYRLMAYEIAIAVVAFGLLVLLLQASAGIIRKLIVDIKVEILLLRARLKNLRISAKTRLRSREV